MPCRIRCGLGRLDHAVARQVARCSGVLRADALARPPAGAHRPAAGRRAPRALREAFRAGRDRVGDAGVRRGAPPLPERRGPPAHVRGQRGDRDHRRRVRARARAHGRNRRRARDARCPDRRGTPHAPAAVRRHDRPRDPDPRRRGVDLPLRVPRARGVPPFRGRGPLLRRPVHAPRHVEPVPARRAVDDDARAIDGSLAGRDAAAEGRPAAPGRAVVPAPRARCNRRRERASEAEQPRRAGRCAAPAGQPQLERPAAAAEVAAGALRRTRTAAVRRARRRVGRADRRTRRARAGRGHTRGPAGGRVRGPRRLARRRDQPARADGALHPRPAAGQRRQRPPPTSRL